MASREFHASASIGVGAVVLILSPVASLAVAQLSPYKPIQLPPTSFLFNDLRIGFGTWWLVAPILFLALTWPSIRRPDRKPLSTAAVLVASVLGSALWYSIAWRHGMEWQGARYVLTTVAANLVVVCILAISVSLTLRRPSFRRTLVTNMILGWWLSWYPFPWFGKWP